MRLKKFLFCLITIISLTAFPCFAESTETAIESVKYTDSTYNSVKVKINGLTTSGHLLLASYTEADKLLNVICTSVTQASSEYAISLDETTETASYFKLMLWESLSSMSPLADVFEVSVSDIQTETIANVANPTICFAQAEGYGTEDSPTLWHGRAVYSYNGIFSKFQEGHTEIDTLYGLTIVDYDGTVYDNDDMVSLLNSTDSANKLEIEYLEESSTVWTGTAPIPGSVEALSDGTVVYVADGVTTNKIQLPTFKFGYTITIDGRTTTAIRYIKVNSYLEGDVYERNSRPETVSTMSLDSTTASSGTRTSINTVNDYCTTIVLSESEEFEGIAITVYDISKYQEYLDSLKE